MFLWIIKSVFYSIFLIILIDFFINNTNYLWSKPKVYEYDKSYSKILAFLQKKSIHKSPELVNNMKLELETFVNELK